MKPIYCAMVFVIFLAACAAPIPPATPSPTITSVPPTAAPTPTPELEPYEIRDANGSLAAVVDIYGKRIMASYEVKVPPATDADWNNLDSRPGQDYSINWNEGHTAATINGIEGLTIDEKGEVAFSFDGKGVETYHLANMKVQTIDGKPTLLVAGYSWNAEAKQWNVYNPGFPMESPKDELGWFTQADIANGNWLRFHQRVTEGTNLEDLTTMGIRPDEWKLAAEQIGARRGVEGSVIHYNKLHWEDSLIEDVNGNKQNIKKAQYPGRAGLSYGYMVDTGCVIASFDALNGDGSVTSLPMIFDDNLWSKYRNTEEFTRVALANGLEWDESMVKDNTFRHSNDSEAWLLWPIASIYPDSTISPTLFGEKDVRLLTSDTEGDDRRAATIQGSEITSSASLEMWLAGVFFNYHQ